MQNEGARVDPAAAYASALWAAGRDVAWLEDADARVSVVGTGPRVSQDAWESAMAALPAGVSASEPGLGWVGWIDYPWMLRQLGLGSVTEPDTRFLRVRGAVRFEGGEARWVQEATETGEPDAVESLAAQRQEALSLLERVQAAGQSSDGEPLPGAGSHPGAASVPDGVRSGAHAASGRTGESAHWRQDGASYARAVREAKARIADGDAYVVCLTTAVDVPGEWDALATFLALRAASPTHHLALIRIGDTSLVAASPERFVAVGEGRVASTVPIKGTRPRGATAAEDAALAAELAADPKERAENLMVVDVARNDLARVCEPGSVQVPRFRVVESYPAVHQLVSEVRGTVEAGRSVAEVLAALAPGTSMTGAPKRRAAQITAGLEPGGRGIYSGAFGWIGAGGCLDLAMSIRCAVVGPERAMIGVGGGVTADSNPEAEWAEAQLKARSTLAALRQS